MGLKIFAVYDKKAQAHMQPFFMHHKGQALRALEDNVNDPQSSLHKHPADYSLWILGEYDERTGLITPYEKPLHVDECSNLVKQGA